MSDTSSTRPALRCAACGTELPSTAKFCIECAHPVASSPANSAPGDLAGRILSATATVEEERKLVTVLFADLKGSTELFADRDPEEARALLDPVLEHMCEAVEQYGGTISQIMGDGIMAIFGAPLAAEDHAVRACHAALGMQDLVRHYGDELQRSHGVPIQIRVGLDSGEVVLHLTGHGLHLSYTAIGLTVNMAARMEQMAKPGTVLAGSDTVRLVEGHVETRSLGPLKVKGFDKLVEVSEVRRAAMTRSRFDTIPVRAKMPFVGRESQLAQLVDAYERVATHGASCVVSLVGDAGMGKSRLLYEFLRGLAGKDVLALNGGAAPYGGGGGYRPGIRILHQYFNISDADDAQSIQQKVAGGIVALSGGAATEVFPILALLNALPADNPFHGLPAEEKRQQVSDALMWLVRRLTTQRAMILAYEDLQWTTSDTTSWLERLVREPPPRTLVLLTFRSDHDARSLTTPDSLEVWLDGLHPSATRELVTGLLGDDRSLEALKDELPERSGGNPLFIEEHMRSMIESGVLAGEPGRYRMDSPHGMVEIPRSVRAVLAARIDRLGRTEKHILQTLAVVGDVAAVGVLSRVVEVPADELRKYLRRLQTAGLLVERTEGEHLAYEFKHSLMQAVAYDSLLHERRRELHLRILEAVGGSGDFNVLARHAVLGEAWDRALTYLRDAGKAAFANFAEADAVSYFERALDVLRHLPSKKEHLEAAIDLRFDLRNALVPLGKQQRILEVLREAEQLADDLRDDRRLAQILAFVSNCYGNIGRSDLALDAAERSLTLGETFGETRMLVVSHLSVGEIYRTLGDYRKARTSLTRALELIGPGAQQDRLGQVGLPSVRARSHLAWTLAELGDFPAAHAAAEEGMRLADASGHSYTLSHGCLGLGGVHLRQGEFQAAIPILARGLAASDRVPLLRPPIAADLGVAYARCGNIKEGLTHLHAAVDAARSMGRLSRLPLMLVKCGEIHLVAGERGEAAQLAETALRLSLQQKERGNEVYALHLLAEIHAMEVGGQTAERFYREALERAMEIGMAPLAARCHAGLAAVHGAMSRPDAAEDHRERARRMYRSMGMRFWLGSLETVTADSTYKYEPDRAEANAPGAPLSGNAR
ncbi:MAG TPA: adenylate/guanylate cyclase domain-containing protein [Casimicrobiaceae bacterium]|nr:adenylate/guanylate cyclase domain-containing protein [Casimicrobiaceae bacterium]